MDRLIAIRPDRLTGYFYQNTQILTSFFIILNINCYKHHRKPDSIILCLCVNKKITLTLYIMVIFQTEILNNEQAVMK